MCAISDARKRYAELIGRLGDEEETDRTVKTELKGAVKALDRKLERSQDWAGD